MKKIHYFMAIAGAAIMMLPACKEKDTQEPASPTVQTAAVTDITENGATAGGSVDYSGTLTEFGICWSTDVNPTVANNKVVADTKQNPTGFTVNITGLTSGTVYHVKAYATTSKETIYGDERSFTTDGQLALALPFMERFDGATFPPKFWEMIDHDGDGNVWYAYSNRFIGAMSDSYSDDGDDLDPYNFLISPKITISGTNPKLEWNIGSAASSEVEEHYKVVVATERFTDENCESNGKIVFEETLADGTGKTVVNRAVDMKDYVGKDVYIAWVHYDCPGVYALLLTDIRISSNENPVPVTAPVMGDLSVTEGSSPGLYTLESIISNDGGVSVVDRGFCYSTSPNPTIEDNPDKITAYASDVLSSFSDDLTFEVGKTYYIRAYAKNAIGITYSNEQTLTVPATTTVWLEQSFATDPFENGSGWTTIDRDGDGYSWEWYDGAMTSDSWRGSGVGALTPENYLISPAFAIGADASNVTLAFQVAAEDDSDYGEKYKVIVSENAITFDNCRDAAVLQDWTELTEASSDETFTDVSIDMSSYAGKTVYIGIVHGNCTDQYYILVRNLKVYTPN